LRRTGHPLDGRTAKLGAVVVREHQHLAEGDALAGLGVELGDGDHVLGGDAVLLAAGLDHCEHRSSSCSCRALSEGLAGPASWQFRLRDAAF